MNGAALGTTIVFAKFIFLPQREAISPQEHQDQGFWWAIAVLLGGLVLANGVYYQAYTLENIAKPLITIGLGWLIYGGLATRWQATFSQVPEQFEHLIGGMSLMLMILFWVGWAKWEPLF